MFPYLSALFAYFTFKLKNDDLVHRHVDHARARCPIVQTDVWYEMFIMRVGAFVRVWVEIEGKSSWSVVLVHHGDTTEVGLVVFWLCCSTENVFNLRKIRTRRLVAYQSSPVVDCVFEACIEEMRRVRISFPFAIVC
jgi:hypothetical protein